MARAGSTQTKQENQPAGRSTQTRARSSSRGRAILEAWPNPKIEIDPPAANPAKPHTIPDDDIRRRAYEIYLRRRGGTGDATQDWLQAERELLAERDARG